MNKEPKEWAYWLSSSTEDSSTTDEGCADDATCEGRTWSIRLEEDMFWTRIGGVWSLLELEWFVSRRAQDGQPAAAVLLLKRSRCAAVGMAMVGHRLQVVGFRVV
ncbi:uncharacterized protein BJ212DRAFT_1305854 [Suillus subaureus]|uniref:Uncharacterized protein n=1 Tax=Suillus subaureus TaxID=48587 RepID=A0A9P7DLS9_9AGAM|nr:uncharacterized protein BJ212DRAFT_1305854 [Suillus subaureus]KAG1797949.1 hypothetical protein BJ212DRAFT_1305854 [Suillus subaureus]